MPSTHLLGWYPCFVLLHLWAKLPWHLLPSSLLCSLHPHSLFPTAMPMRDTPTAGFWIPCPCVVPPLGTVDNLGLYVSSAKDSPGWAGAKHLVVLILCICVHSDPQADAPLELRTTRPHSFLASLPVSPDLPSPIPHLPFLLQPLGGSSFTSSPPHLMSQGGQAAHTV